MSHKMVRPFNVKVSVLGYFPYFYYLYFYVEICINVYTNIYICMYVRM